MPNLYKQEPPRPRIGCIVIICLVEDLFDSIARKTYESHEYSKRW